MSFMNGMLGPVPRIKNQQPVIVGLPFENVPFCVHPIDNTPEECRVYLYYDGFDTASYCIDAQYVQQERLFDRGLKNLSSNILYRAVYENGKEFIIPVADYGDGFRDSLLKMVDESRSGDWMVRIPYPSQKKLFNYSISNNPYSQPRWSSLTFDKLLEKTFINHKIAHGSHVVAKAFEFVKDKKTS